MLTSIFHSPIFWVVTSICVVILAIVVYSACVLGGRADDASERQLHNAVRKNGK
ncbi:MAG: hypothetical protein HYT13_01225 [Candidatus Liptonbacteria bacterium]|nr:hypothetical protein [Candidatus Liptonbacteria bacterium]